jgi:hypothetical protein
MRNASAIVLVMAGAAGVYGLAQRQPHSAGAVPPGAAVAPTAAPAESAANRSAAERPEVPPPPFTDGIFPCSNCHNADMPPNRTRRELAAMHDDIVLRHDEQHRWCLDCHDADNRDQLHLASGEPVPFEESYRLCGQCHGEKYRDWRAGVHGRRVGEWNGHRKYLLCAHCHNPHQPRFRPIEPMPAPVRPARSAR